MPFLPGRSRTASPSACISGLAHLDCEWLLRIAEAAKHDKQWQLYPSPRAGVLLCRVVRYPFSSVTVALLGRFLPRLGPLRGNAWRPFFMPEHAIELALLCADATAASWVIIQGGVPLP